MGFADAPATVNALAGQGVYVSGYQWRWAVGLKDGTYPPHLELDHEVQPFETSFEAQPGEDWNGDACMCAIVPQYRGPDGRFAKPGFVREPRFAPPVTASAQIQPFDWSPLVEALSVERPLNVSLALPQGSIVVNVPPSRSPDVVVNVPKADTPVVNVAAPDVRVAAPTVNVESPTVTVAAPTVKVEPHIEIKPVVKVIREKINRVVNFRRNSAGLIEEATVEE